MKATLLFSLVFTYTWIINSYLVNGSVHDESVKLISEAYFEDTPPDPPIYPPRWTATAHFQFINASNNFPAGAGILYQIIDSINQKFRADDLYFAGTFPVPYDTLFASSTPLEKYLYYASLTANGISCVIYPGNPVTLSQNWIAELCSYNSTLYYQTTKAYRWNCATDVVTWFIDTAAVDGRLIYQHTLPQPLFNVYQDLWFTNYTVILEEIDQTVFIPPKGWNCPNYESAQSVKHTSSITLLFIPILLYNLKNNYIN
ncbi:unnamed protein product [Rotaria sp. Silwood2]|nr:unnamed protein product [Rotaria sp. Silwood2]CAF2798100.1 unnamed protein product [Rotaria sp. Silwood2]CAF4106099.1 unnamed protein product [Rotaria sp. Silwood2]CAF4161411.1 unnamed protein product [Rotaria sp. Silwood2]